MTNHNNKITFIATGGTIDSVFDAPSERKVIKSESGIPAYIETVIAPHFDIETEKVVMIDSLDMKNEHREKILDAIKNTQNDKIIVTHGTDTMIDTAQYLQEHIGAHQKTIIFVGSMIPLEGFYHSDAPFNLGYAIAQVQNQKDGIYICMNARCFTPDEVIKNREIGRFNLKDAS